MNFTICPLCNKFAVVKYVDLYWAHRTLESELIEKGNYAPTHLDQPILTSSSANEVK